MPISMAGNTSISPSIFGSRMSSSSVFRAILNVLMGVTFLWRQANAIEDQLDHARQRAFWRYLVVGDLEIGVQIGENQAVTVSNRQRVNGAGRCVYIYIWAH